MVVAAEVPAGKTGAFLDIVKKQRAVVQQHAPSNKLTVYAPMVSSSPNMMVLRSEFPSAEAWGEASGKIAADPQTQANGEALTELGARIVANLIQANVTPPGGSSAMFEAGSVAMVFLLRVPPDKQPAALDIFSQMRDVVQRHAPQNRISVWSTVVGGAGTGGMTVLSEFPSAAAWGAAGPKISRDAAYQRLSQQLAALGAEVQQTVLVRNVTP